MDKTALFIGVFIMSATCDAFFFNIDEKGYKKHVSDRNFFLEAQGKDRLTRSYISTLQDGNTVDFASNEDLRVSVQQNKIRLRPLSASANDLPTIQQVLDKVFDRRDLSATTGMLDGTESQFAEATFDTQSKEAVISGKLDGITLFDEMQLEDIDILLEWIEDKTIGNPFGLNRLRITLSATITPFSKRVEFQAVKEKNSDRYAIKKFNTLDDSPNIKMFDFLPNLNTNLGTSSFAPESSDVDYDKLEDMIWRDGFIGFGSFDLSHYELLLKSKTDNEQAEPFSGTTNSQRIVIDGGSSSLNAALITLFPSIQPVGDIINSISTSENRDASIADRIENRKWCLLLSSADFNIDVLPELRDLYSEAISDCYPALFETGVTQMPVLTGMSVKAQVQLRNSLTDCKNKVQVENQDSSQIPEAVAITGQATGTGFLWTFPEETKMTLTPYLKCLAGTSEFFDLPNNLFGNKNIVHISDYYRTIKPGNVFYLRVGFKFQPPDEYRKIPHTSIVLEDCDITFELEGEDLKLTVTANIVTQNTNIKVNFMCETESPFDEFSCTIYIPSLTLAQIFVEIFKPEFQEIVQKKLLPHLSDKVKKSGVKDLEIQFTYGDNRLSRVRCELIIGEVKGIFVEVIVAHGNGFAFGFYKKPLNLEQLARNFLNDDSISIPWLSRMETKFKISTIDDDGDNDDNGDNDDDKKKRNKIRRNHRKLTQQQQQARRNTTKTFLKNERKNVTKPITHEKSLNKNKNIAPIKTKGLAQKRSLKKGKKIKDISLKKFRKLNSNFSKRDDDDDDNDDDDDDDDDDIEFLWPGLHGFSTNRGTAFSATWWAPENKAFCQKNAICELIFEKAPDSQIDISAEFENGVLHITGNFTGSIPLVKDGETDILFFEQAQLQLRTGPDGFIKVSCKMVYKSGIEPTPLRFQGIIKLLFSGSLQLEFTMSTMIRPEAIPRLGFGNILLGAEITFRTGRFRLSVGCEVNIGVVRPKVDEDRVIKIVGYFGFNPSVPADFWIYVEANELTLLKIAKAFEMEQHLPQIFHEQGFPEGFTFSWAKEEQTIEGLGVTVPKGLRIYGTIKVFFFEAHADVTITYENPKDFDITIIVKISPINWLNGLIQISKAGDSSKGPHFLLKAKPDFFTCDISGEISIFGIVRRSVAIEFGGTKMNLTTSGTLFPGIFEGSLQILAVYGSDTSLFFDELDVTITITQSRFIDKIKETMESWLTGKQKEVNETVNRVEQRKITAEESSKTGKDTSKKLTGETSNWKEGLETRKKRLEEKKEGDLAACESNCPKVCFPFFGWNKHCWKAWGIWIGCPKWNSCFKKIPNLICLAECALKRIASAFIAWVEQTIQKIAYAVQSLYKGLKKLIDNIKAAAEALAAAAVKLWKKVVEGIKTLIAKTVLALLKNFALRDLSLKASLRTRETFRLCFSFAYNVTFFGYTFDKSHDENQICLDDIIMSIIRSICSVFSPLKGFLGIGRAKEEIKGEEKAVDEAEIELKDTETKSDDKVQLELAKEYKENLEKRGQLPTRAMFHFIRRLTKNHKYTAEEREFLNRPDTFPHYQLKSPTIARSFAEHAPWVVAEEQDPMQHNFRPENFTGNENIKRNLIIGSELNPCDKIKRTLQNYALLSNGLLQTGASVQKVKAQHKIHKRTLKNDLRQFHDKTIKLGNSRNYTKDQLEDINYWFKELSEGYSKHSQAMRRSFIKQHSMALPVIRSQLDYVLRNGMNSSFEDYTNHLHETAVNAYRRSIVPTPENVKVEKLLHNIKKDLVSIISRAETPTRETWNKLNDVNKNIRSMNAFVQQCTYQPAARA